MRGTCFAIVRGVAGRMHVVNTNQAYSVQVERQKEEQIANKDFERSLLPEDVESGNGHPSSIHGRTTRDDMKYQPNYPRLLVLLKSSACFHVF